MASAQGLPTVQIDGVAWAQVIAGNRVYVGGRFDTARPAGAAPGQRTTPRVNLLAYDLATGALVTWFNAPTNGQVRGLAASPDGKTIYLAGDFTTVGGQPRSRIAAVDSSTGRVLPWAPPLNGSARSVVTDGVTVYVGGDFTAASGQGRQRVAAFAAANGALRAFNPGANSTVWSMTLAAGKLIAGGAFDTYGGVSAQGMGAVDAASGQARPWPANKVVHDYGSNAAITSLTSDGTRVYGTGFVFGGDQGNLEGSFAAHASSGEIDWIEDCHGDSYSIAAVKGNVFLAGHPYLCDSLPSGFPGTPTKRSHHGLAFTAAPSGERLSANLYGGYGNFAGQPTTRLLNWYPDFTPGTFTGSYQGPWHVTANDRYVVMGGEFTAVNGVPQQGLVRFPLTSTAPGNQGPRLRGAGVGLTAISTKPRSMRIAWPTNIDRDDSTLTYTLTSGGRTLFSGPGRGTFFGRRGMGITQSGLVAGSSHTYTLRVSDRHGHAVTQSVTARVTGPAPGAYRAAVLADAPDLYWPLNESAGGKAVDWARVEDGRVIPTALRGTAGALGNSTDTSTTLVGGGSGLTGTTRQMSPSTYSTETWFRTTSVSGGPLVGFDNREDGVASRYDRKVYLSNDGRVVAAVNAGFTRQHLASGPGLNDGAWHHVVATYASGRLELFVDGARVGSRAIAGTPEVFPGWWRVGHGTQSGWPLAPEAASLGGDLDEVAIYPKALTHARVLAHYAASGRQVGTMARTARTGHAAAVRDARATSYWPLDGAGSVRWKDVAGNRAVRRTGTPTPIAAGVFGASEQSPSTVSTL